MVASRKVGVPARYAEVYAGRPSVLGNPFRVGASYGQGEAAAAYLPYLRERCQKGGAVKEEILRLAVRAAAGERLAITCWCSPKPCHAGHIVSAVRNTHGGWWRGRLGSEVSLVFRGPSGGANPPSGPERREEDTPGPGGPSRP